MWQVIIAMSFQIQAAQKHVIVQNKNLKMNDVAVCLSGAARELDRPCTGVTFVNRLIRPLNAHVFIFLNAPSSKASQVYASVLRIFNRTDVRALEVLHVDSTPTPKNTTTCSEGYGYNNGYPQSIGFMRCATLVVPQNYSWIFRMRPDVTMNFGFERLPLPFQGANQNLVIANTVAACFCGYNNKRVWEGTCLKTKQLCGCIGDAWAMVHGRAAQRAYFEGYHDDFITCARTRSAASTDQFAPKRCPQCIMAARLPTPECRLGTSLARRGIPVYDMRWLFDPFRGTNGIQHARALDTTACATVGSSMYDTRWVSPSAIQAIPPGPWDLASQERQEVYCKYTPEKRPAPWSHMCQ